MTDVLVRKVPVAFSTMLEPKRYKGIFGGRGSGKSHFFAEQVVLRCFRENTRVVCLREVQSSIKESVKQLIQDKISDMGLGSAFRIMDDEIRGNNGSQIIFKGLQSFNSENIKSLEGFDIAWIEEAQTLSAHSLRMLRPTIRKPDSELWFSWNPRFKSDAVDTFFRIAPPKEAFCVRVSWKDNPWFPDVLRADMISDFERTPEMAHHVWDGGYEIAAEGSYYGKDILLADQEARITEVPYDRSTPVYSAFDLGIGDSTAIWLFQRVGVEWHFLKYYENHGVGIDHYIDWIKGQPYLIEENVLPFDAEARELQTGKSRHQFMMDRGMVCSIVPKHAIADGIAAVRVMLGHAWFDRDGCSEGLDSLRTYRSEFSEKNQVYALRPLHDSSSHGADAMRYAAMGGPDPQRMKDWKKPIIRNLRVVV